MCVNYLYEALNEEKINQLMSTGPCYYNVDPGRYNGTVKQVDFYIDYSKKIPISIIQIECRDFMDTVVIHPLVVYLDRLNKYSQKILKNLDITFNQSLVPQFERLAGNELTFEVRWIDDKQTYILDARIIKKNNHFNNQVVAHLGKLDEPVILDKCDCDLLNSNSKVNLLESVRVADYVDDLHESSESYYSKFVNQLF